MFLGQHLGFRANRRLVSTEPSAPAILLRTDAQRSEVLDLFSKVLAVVKDSIGIPEFFHSDPKLEVHEYLLKPDE
jgi:hypothetical protein